MILFAALVLTIAVVLLFLSEWAMTEAEDDLRSFIERDGLHPKP